MKQKFASRPCPVSSLCWLVSRSSLRERHLARSPKQIFMAVSPKHTSMPSSRTVPAFTDPCHNLLATTFSPQPSRRIALQQRTTGDDPHGFTPLHFLCQDSDHSYRKVEASSQGTGFQPNAPSSSTGQGSYNWSTWQAYAGEGDRSSRDWPS